MSKDLNDFGNKNIFLLTQFQDKVREIEAFIDKEINSLVSLSKQHLGQINDIERILLDGLIRPIKSKNNVASTQLSNFLIKSEEILARLFMEEKETIRKQLENIKTIFI